MQRVAIMVPPEAIAVSVVGLHDILHRVKSLHEELTQQPDESIGFRVALVSTESELTVPSASGLPIACHRRLADQPEADIIIVPALRSVAENLSKRYVSLIQWLTAQSGRDYHL